MEAVVTMSLEEFKNLIIENTSLKNMLSNFKKRITEKAFDEIRDSYIDNIKTSNEALEYLKYDNSKILEKFASGYSYTWRSISNDTYNIMSENEIKLLVVSEIKKRIDAKYVELKESEKENETGGDE